jgi:hypothetical protein
MREAINNNPLVQIGLIALLGIGVAFLLMTRVLKEETKTPTEGSAPATGTEAPAAPAGGAAPAAGTQAPAAPSEPAEPVVPPATEAPTTEFTAGPGLPEKVVDAYDDGDTVVLLITRKGGIDDNGMRKIVELTTKQTKGDVTVIQSLAREIAKYSRITQGVDVDRVPAMIVLGPKKVSGDVPHASVSYGFRGPGSVQQAIDDAAYEGKEIPYFPE